MGHTPQPSYAWYENDSRLPLPDAHPDPAVPRLQESWQHYDWRLAVIAFAAVWIVDSWMLGGSQPGMAGISYMAWSLGNLILIVALCCGIFHFWKGRSMRVGQAVCLVLATAVLLARGL